MAVHPAGEPAPEAPAAHAATPDRLRDVGERIEMLLEASAGGPGGTIARERAEELVRLVADLYGAGLERILELLRDGGRLDDRLLAELVGDDLVASLLLVHGLHPHDVTTRVEAALESVRPYLGSHGGDVELVGVDAAGVVALRLLGSCDGCPSSSVTLKLAVEDAVRAAAPETTAIAVETAAAGSADGGPLIAVDSLRTRLVETSSSRQPETDETASWQPVPDLAGLAPGQLAGFAVAGVEVFACRVGADVLVFLDRCGRCGQSMAGATLARRLGGSIDEPLLRCPTCATHFDVRHAGAGVGTGVAAGGSLPHLDPLPALVRDGVPCVAVPAGVPA